ncbi:MAG: hypothetical protein LUD82_08415 [Clostridiales bacterium]|nr:hypothetical protein [Clostridiales bacterium]
MSKNIAGTLHIDVEDYEVCKYVVDGAEILYRLYAEVPYVSKPNAPHLQVMNVYVPEEALEKGGAPILLSQLTGGMGEAEPNTVETDRYGYILRGLKEGYVVASPGARGRETVVDSVYVGRGDLPMSIVDLKAAVAYLRYNEEALRCDAERIIFDGTSSGGGMAALMGSTGNSPYFKPYLQEIGAADARDDIFLASVNSPITDMEHIDAAYEWWFSADNAEGLYEGDPLSEKMSRALAETYVDYVNSYEFKNPETGEVLTIGEGDTYTRYLIGKLEEAATIYLAGLDDEGLKAWFNDAHNKNVVTWDGEKAHITSVRNYINWNTGRWMKYFGCYDGFLSKPSRENEALGTTDGGLRHFSKTMAKVVAGFAGYEEIADQWQKDAAVNCHGEYMINPMNFIGTGEECTLAPIWYMRCGGRRETTANLFLNLYLLLENKTDAVVNFRYSWMQRHTCISNIEIDEAFEFYNKYCFEGK